MDFYLPTKLMTGRGVVAKNASLLAALGRRCLIVTGGSAAKRCGALSDVCAALDGQGIAWSVYDGVQPNPSIASCIEGGKKALECGAEFIIGIGGGSPLDAAKIVAVSAANPTLDADGLYRMHWESSPLPTVLVGTTAGTGSEVTPVAVITDTAKRKHSFRDDAIYATLAFGDPRYTETMPLSVTASTGVDALAHCVESYFSKKATDISRAFALQGISVLLPPLRSVAAGQLPTPEQRETLYHGAILGGMAISVTGTVMPHNLGYYLTEEHGVPHGWACAVFLPALLRHAESCDEAYVRALCERTGCGRDSLIALTEALVPDLGIRITEAEVERILPRWENNGSILKTIGTVTPDQIRRIFTELFVKG